MVTELRLLRELALAADFPRPDDWLSSLTVEEMDDGGVGSLRFVNHVRSRQADKVVCRAALRFFDADGVEVIASLNTDAHGAPIELDMWKTDFSRLIRIPESFLSMDE